MRITYRRKDNREYWSNRWADIPVDYPMSNLDAYPLKFAELVIQSKDGKILEAGCGAGRVLRYYKDKGYDIVGIDFIKEAVEKLKKIDSKLNVEVGDITDLNFPDEYFRYVLAFGLYHNLEFGLKKALDETYRVLEPGGKVCASFRADNFQTLIVDWLAEYRARRQGVKARADKFHKINLRLSELVDLFKRVGFCVESAYPVENMPIFYKFRFFRSKEHKDFNENLARKEGYRLSPFGYAAQKLLMKYFPRQFCNIFVLIAGKKKAEKI